MNLMYIRTEFAYKYTVQYYDIEIIKAHIERISLGYHNYLNDWDEVVLSYQNSMENEILQTILTNNKAGIIHLFERLREMLTNYRISTVNVAELKWLINNYNENEYQEYVKKVEDKETEFKSTLDYQNLDHLQEHDVISFAGGFGMIGMLSSNRTTKKEPYYKFFTNWIKSEQIDADILTDYVNYITPVINNFKSILERYLKRFDEGNIDLPSFATPALPTSPQLLIEQHRTFESAKLKFKLTVEQVAYLFKILKSNGILDAETDSELQRFIIEHITTPKATKTISKSSLANAFSSPTKDTANKIATILKKLRDEALGF